MKYKKAEIGGDAPLLFQYGMVSLFIITAAFFLFLFIIGTMQNSMLETKPTLNRDLLIARFVYSPDCFVKYDVNTMRAYPFVLDWDKFTQDNLNSCMKSKEGFRLTLINGGQYKVINSNAWKGQTDFSVERKVIIDGGTLSSGILRIEVQNEDES